MPQLGESVDKGTITAWHKKPGDRIEVDEILLEIETDKVATEVPSLVAGTVKSILFPAGETARVGAVLCVIEGEGEASSGRPSTGSGRTDTPGPAAAPSPASAPTSPARPEPVEGRSRTAARRTAPDGTPLSPAVRRLLAHHDLDPAAIRGTGRDGRIQRSDVLAHIEAGNAVPAPAPAPAPAIADGPDTERVPFSTLRKRIAENMARSKAQSAHVLQAVEVDFSGVERVRAVFRQAWKDRHGGSLTYLPFIARAVCLALPDFPHLNAQRDGNTLVLHKRIHLGFAIDLDRAGLVAPVLRNAGEMNIPALARGVAELAERARAGKLSPDDMSGAGYTITNNGSFGTLITAPIINQPQVAILSTDGVRRRPWVVDGPDGEEIAIRPVGVLAQSFDHCVVDGSCSGAFLGRLKELLETHDWLQEFV